jgi:hypothetical protein
MLTRAYVFAEKVLDINYKNVIVRTIAVAIKDLDLSIGPKSVGVVNSSKPLGSLLQHLIVDNIALIAYNNIEEGGR